MREILSRTVFETCLADQSEAPWEEEVRMLLAHDAALRALLLEVAEGGVEFEDPRVRYVAVQIDADTWARVKALTAPAEREERGKEKGNG